MKRLFVMILALCMLLCCGCNSDPESTATTETEVTTEPVELAPNFQVYDRDGNPVMLSDMFGKPIVLNFWATWCGPCKTELPAFQQAYENYGDDVVFMMVDMTEGRTETKNGAIEYVDGMGYTFPVYFDEDQHAVSVYAINAVPVTIVLNEKGEIVADHTGAMSYEELEAMLQQVL